MTLKPLGSDHNNQMLRQVSHHGLFLLPFLIYPLTTSGKQTKVARIHKDVHDPTTEGHRLTHALSLNVLSDPVGKTFLSPCYRGKAEAQRESLPVSPPALPPFRRKVAPRTPLSAGLHSQRGRAGPSALPTEQRPRDPKWEAAT